MGSASSPRRVRVERGIYRQPNGKYAVCCRRAGKLRFRTTGFDLADARRERTALIASVQRDEEPVSPTLRFGTVTGWWLERFESKVAAGERHPRTLEAHRYQLDRHLLPPFGTRRIATISVDDVAELLQTMRRRGCSARTVANALATMHSIMRYARRHGWICVDPVGQLEPDERPRAEHRAQRVLGRDEIERLLGACSSRDRLMVSTVLYTGMRISEMLGLVWDDIDFAAGLVRVRAQLSRAHRGEPARRVAPKTAASIRDIPLVAQLAELLAHHKRKGRFADGRDWVFATARGTPYGHRNVSRRGLRRAAQIAGLNRGDWPPLRFHDLRHAFASHLIVDLGLDVAQVSRILGHARVTITLDVYTHLFDDARHARDIRARMAASQFAALLPDRRRCQRAPVATYSRASICSTALCLRAAQASSRCPRRSSQCSTGPVACGRSHGGRRRMPLTSIMQLLNQVADDQVVLPAIQRDFVWSEEQTEVLLDSIMRGYPIGIALLWETYNDIQYRTFARDFRSGTLHSYRDNPDHRRLRIVLDGQQRLQSLYIALRGQRDGSGVHFDVLSGQRWEHSDQERFLFDFLDNATADKANRDTEAAVAQRGEEDGYETPLWWIRARDLFAMDARTRRELARDLTRKLALNEEDSHLVEENVGIFDDVFTRDQNILKLSTIDEDLPSDSPKRKTETDVLEIFVRINRNGTALSRSDLIFSMLKLNWRESAEGLPEFVASINEGNSFELDHDFVVRCLFAVSGLGGKLNIDLLRSRSNMTRLQRNFEQCCDAIRATVDFVRDHCACQSSRLLGSSTTLVPVVHYLFGLPRHEVPNNQIDRLRSAVYLFALARPFSRYGESRVGAFVRSELDARGDDDQAFPLEAAIRRVRGWEHTQTVEDLAEANPDLALHLVQGLSGAKVKYSRNAPEVDHIFPRAELRRKNYDEEDIDDIANFWILAQNKNRNKSNRKPKDYFADVGQQQLQRALIDRDLLDYRRFRRFIRERRARVVEALSAKIGLTDDDLRRA